MLVDYLKRHNPIFGKAWISTLLTLSNSGQTKAGLDPDSGCYHETFTLGDDLIDFLTDSYKVGKASNAILDIQYDILDYLVGSCEDNTKKKPMSLILRSTEFLRQRRIT